ncbi:hypothetical protein J4Q44_G00118350 [Coregonus suidteri]|uniref:Fish virus induced TRIM protein n=1 Tax=Coregonus suidteri TaxID=861788 RepID=A0AAN8QWJ0_9TELE
MAQQGVLLDQDQFCCSVCLDLLKEPVTTACGHSYCRSCIEGCWDKNVLKGVYSCPQCRQTFTPRPTLRKNNMLAEVVEKLKKTGLQAAPPPTLCYAGPRDVACDFCTGTRKQKALMSCLACLASYCETHLQPHYEVPAFKKHKLIKATAQLQEKICSHHDKLLEVYCRTDQQCICMLCVMDVHKGHDTVSATAERTEKQKQLGMSQQKVQQRVQKREKELKELKQAVESLKHSAQAAVEDSEKIFTQLIRSIERRCSEVKELIRAQEKAQVSQAEFLLEQLKQEIAELRKTNTELEQLSHTEDHIHFLQNYQSLSSPSVSSDLPSITVRPLQYFGYVNKTVSELREKLEYFLKGEWTKISTTVNVADILPTEPKTREQFLQYSCQLTLNPNTACEELFLTEGKRKTKLKPHSASKGVGPAGAADASPGLRDVAHIRHHQRHTVEPPPAPDSQIIPADAYLSPSKRTHQRSKSDATHCTSLGVASGEQPATPRWKAATMSEEKPRGTNHSEEEEECCEICPQF